MTDDNEREAAQWPWMIGMIVLIIGLLLIAGFYVIPFFWATFTQA